MRPDPKDYRVKPKERVRLSKWPTDTKPLYHSREDFDVRLHENVTALSSQQDLFYASNKHAMLIVFQAMDAAGKDGIIKTVLSGINPQGCRVTSFKHPSAQELNHDFLWRTTQQLPERGMIGVFNRSYYEEVLIARVHPHILRAQNIPRELVQKEIWHERYESIRGLETHLTRNGTKVLKFFLHLSKEEQRERFLKRIDDPNKNWKFSPSDIEERKFWNDYMRAYEKCLHATSTEQAPWFIVPADDKRNARLIVSEIILDALRALTMSYPDTSLERRAELAAIREDL